MKKILSIALVIVMMMAMSVNAFAATAGTETLSSADLPYTTPELDVIVRLDSDGDGTPDLDDTDGVTKSIIVEVSWTDMEFIYSKTWDAYTAETTGEWLWTDQFVSVTNRSNVGVTAEFSYTDNADNAEDYTLDFSVRELTSATEDGTGTVTENRISNATFENMVLTLANPADETVELGTDEEGNKIMPYADIAVNVSDDKVPAVDSKDVVGTITVTIAMVEETVEPAYTTDIAVDGIRSSSAEFTVPRNENLTISVAHNGTSIANDKVNITVTGANEEEDYTLSGNTLRIIGPETDTVTLSISYDTTNYDVPEGVEPEEGLKGSCTILLNVVDAGIE